MANTRANSAAGRIAKPVKSFATTAATNPVGQPTTDAHTEIGGSAETPDLQSQTVPPLLSRLVPSLVVKNMELEQTQPSIGASVTTQGSVSGEKTVWLPAAAWDGVAFLVRQTRNDCRPGVAALLMVVESCLVVGTPLQSFIQELISEVEQDPYGDLPQTPLDAFDFSW